MHRNDFLHRDIKPENIVMSHVRFEVCREFVRFATLDGRLAARPRERLVVERWTILVRRWLLVLPIQNRLIFGPLGCWLTR